MRWCLIGCFCWTLCFVHSGSEVSDNPASVVEVGSKVSGSPGGLVGHQQSPEVNNRFFLSGGGGGRDYDSCYSCTYYNQNQVLRCCTYYRRCCRFVQNQQPPYYPNNNNNNNNWYPSNNYPNNYYPNNYYPGGYGKPGSCPNNYYGRSGGRGFGNKRSRRESENDKQESDRRQFGYDNGGYPGGSGVYFQCSQDYDCPGRLKCCSVGFQRSCSYPVSPYYGSGGSGGFGGQNWG